VLFWLAAIAVIWPFVCMSRRALGEAKELLPDVEASDTTFPLPPVFGEAAVMRSLVLFNLLFAVQTVMDIGYLWGGAALPDGMTYADYAHRGAYPLILAALLAAAFVVAAMRPGSAAERAPRMRVLVFLWIAQTVLLVVSSILRLDLYVAAYSLTYLRVAAFVWMLLVAIGLLLIVARIVLYRSNMWLVAANLSALALVVYVCAFVNVPYVIASYNVAHSREMGGGGVALDLNYVLGLGPQAIPAIDRYIATRPGTVAWPPTVARRDALASSYRRDMSNWRAWNFRGWRLDRYLVDNPSATAAYSSTSP
jgi:hypothetical protein